MKRDPRLGRAEALRRSMQALIASGGRFAHPANWALVLRVEEGVGVVDLDQAALSDLQEARRGGAGEIAVVADEEAGDVALLQLLLERFLALDVEMVGRLVEQVEVGRSSFIFRNTSRARSPWLSRPIGSRMRAKGKPAWARAGGSPPSR